MSSSVLIVIGPFAGLAGVFVGAWLTRSWQRRQWVQDNKKAEYRELISGLSQSANLIRTFGAPFAGGGISYSGEELREREAAESRAYNLISDRLFLADVMTREKVRDRWLEVVKSQRELGKFWGEWSALYNTLLEAARRDLKLSEGFEMTRTFFKRGLTRLWIVLAGGFDLWCLVEFLLHGGKGDMLPVLAIVAAINVAWFVALWAIFWVVAGFAIERAESTTRL
jgi:hypothetical protein